jgi:hypothetical protein
MMCPLQSDHRFHNCVGLDLHSSTNKFLLAGSNLFEAVHPMMRTSSGTREKRNFHRGAEESLHCQQERFRELVNFWPVMIIVVVLVFGGDEWVMSRCDRKSVVCLSIANLSPPRGGGPRMDMKRKSATERAGRHPACTARL